MNVGVSLEGKSMPNKDRQKRSVRKARAAERKELEARRAASAPADVKKKGVLAAKDDTKKPAKAAAKKNSGPFKGIREWFAGVRGEMKNSGPFKGIREWFAGVRGEMKRVTWPSKDELKNYSVAVVAMLIVFGVAVALVDTGVVSALVGFSGLRG